MDIHVLNGTYAMHLASFNTLIKHPDIYFPGIKFNR